MVIIVPIILVREIIILLLTEEVSVHQLPDQLILLLDKVFAVQVVQVQIAELWVLAIILVAVAIALFVQEVHTLVEIQKRIHVQAVHVLLVLVHAILVPLIIEVIVRREVPEQIVAVAVVAIHVEVPLLHQEVIRLTDHHPALLIQVVIQEVVEVAIHQVVAVVILVVLAAVAVLHVVAAVVVLHVVLVVAIEDSL